MREDQSPDLKGCFPLLIIMNSLLQGLQEMDTEVKNANLEMSNTGLFVRWGHKKRLRCVRPRDSQVSSQRPDDSTQRRVTSRIDRFLVSSQKDSQNNENKNLEFPSHRSNAPRNRKTFSPEKEDRFYTTRNSTINDDSAKFSRENPESDKKTYVFPKLYIGLSNKEKEEDFMVMKGCKLPQRPKKRSKSIQKTILMVSPGAWLTDLCQERYEVREKKKSKKRPRGLKAMGSMDSDTE